MTELQLSYGVENMETTITLKSSLCSLSGRSPLNTYCWKVRECVCTLSCLTLCNPMDCSPPGSSVHGIFQERILEQVAIFFSRGSSWAKDQTRVSCVSCTGRQICTIVPPAKKILKGCCWATKKARILASGGEGFKPGPETGLITQSFCAIEFLKYKRDRESFWHRHQKGQKEYTLASVSNRVLYSPISYYSESKECLEVVKNSLDLLP